MCELSPQKGMNKIKIKKFRKILFNSFTILLHFILLLHKSIERIFEQIIEYQNYEMSYNEEASLKKQDDLLKKLDDIINVIINSLTVSDAADKVSQKTLVLKLMLLFKFFAEIIPQRKLNIDQQSKIKSLIEQITNWDEIQSITRLLTYVII